MFDPIVVLVVLILIVLLYVHRKKLQVQRMLFPVLYVLLWKSTWGIKGMNAMAKRMPRFIRVLGYLGIILGFIGMLAISVELVFNTVKVFTDSAAPGVQPVLPIEAKGVFFVPFLYWIISIFIVAVVHEFAHGVVARAHKLPVKSSGFAFLCVIIPIIPAAFVEPDEKKLLKAKKRAQLSVFAAGPLANFLTALLVLLMVTALNPVVSATFEAKGVEIVELPDGSPAHQAGLKAGMEIVAIGRQQVQTVENLTAALANYVPGDVVQVVTAEGSVEAVLGGEGVALLGIRGKTVTAVKDAAQAYGFFPDALKWIVGLLVWLFLLNLGIGLFNLLPIGPLDGGRMFLLTLSHWLPERQAIRIFSFVSMFFVILIIANLVGGIM